MSDQVRLSLTVKSSPDGVDEDYGLDVLASFLPRPGDRLPLWDPRAGEQPDWEVVDVEWQRVGLYLRPVVILRGMVATDWGEYRPADGDDLEPRYTPSGIDLRGLLAKGGWTHA